MITDTFMEVVELGSFTAAGATSLPLAAAVSLRSQLEARCELRLVERVGRAVLRPRPGAVIGHARRIRAEAEQALEAMRVHRTGARHAARRHRVDGARLLLPVAAQIAQRLSEHRLIFHHRTSADVVDRLLSNAVDLGFTALPSTIGGLS